MATLTPTSPGDSFIVSDSGDDDSVWAMDLDDDDAAAADTPVASPVGPNVTVGRVCARAAAARARALDRARAIFKRAGYTASGCDFSRMFPRDGALDADEFRSAVRRVLKVAPSVLSDADLRRVFRAAATEDAVDAKESRIKADYKNTHAYVRDSTVDATSGAPWAGSP